MVETEIFKAATSFAKDATNVRYRWRDKYNFLARSLFFNSYSPFITLLNLLSSWRNEKATFKEKIIQTATEKVGRKDRKSRIRETLNLWTDADHRTPI